MAQVLAEVDFDEFNRVREQLFTRLHIEAFAYGNWRPEQAKQLADKVHQLAFSRAKPDEEVFRPVLSLAGQQQLAMSRKLQHHDNAIVMYYQSLDKQPAAVARYTLLNHIIGPEFFHELRTEKQLGYLVGTGFVPLNRFPGLALYIQSPDHQGPALYKEIQTFVEHFCKDLAEVEEQQWQRMQAGLIAQVVEKDSNLRVCSQRLWMSIGNMDTEFDEA